MRYEQKSFTVPVTDGKRRPFCDHTWIRPNGHCMWCDAKVVEGMRDLQRPADPQPVKQS